MTTMWLSDRGQLGDKTRTIYLTINRCSLLLLIALIWIKIQALYKHFLKDSTNLCWNSLENSLDPYKLKTMIGKNKQLLFQDKQF